MNDPTTAQQNEDPFQEAFDLGSLVAWQDNKEMNSGCIGSTEWERIRYAHIRLHELSNIYGEAVFVRFSEGYDETIDLSLNSDWRLDEHID